MTRNVWVLVAAMLLVSATVVVSGGAATATDLPSISIGDAATVEGSSARHGLRFAVTLSHPTTTDVTVAVSTESGTATEGSDFLSGSVSPFIPAGHVSGIATVRVFGDTTVEPTENFRVRLVGPNGAVLGRSVGTGRIIDDDPEPGQRISIGDASVVEGARGTRSARFTVSLSVAETENVTFHYATVGGSALAGTDYRTQDLDGHIPMGSTSVSVPVPVLVDTTAEPTETFTVHLSGVSGVTIGRANGVGTILDYGAPVRGTLSGSGSQTVSGDDLPLLVSVSDGTLNASLVGPATYHLVLMQRTSRSADLTITTDSGTLELRAFENGIFPLVGTPLTVVSGTGRFAHATGTITFTTFTKQSVECIPSPPAPAPDIYCSWDESATLTGAISLH
jgi:hypothetical protein